MHGNTDNLGPLDRPDPTRFWPALTAGILFLIPLVATPLSAEVNWGPLDFLVWGALLFAATSAFIGLARLVPRGRRWIAAAVIGGLFLYVWAELAVGVFLDLGS